MMLKRSKIKEIRMAFVYQMMETSKDIKVKEISDSLGISGNTVYKYKQEFVDRQNIGEPLVKYDVTGYKVPTTAEEALAIYNEIEELEQVTQKSEEEMDKFFAEEQQKEAEKVELKVEEQSKAKVVPKYRTKHKTKPIYMKYTNLISSSSTKKCSLLNGLVKVVRTILRKVSNIGII